MLADFCKHLLHNDKLVGYKGEIHRKFTSTGKALDVQDGIGEAEQITEHGVILLVQCLQLLFRLWLLFQDALLNNFIHRGGGQAETRFKTGLDAGKLISADLDNLINGLLSGAHHPHFTAALAANLFGQGL